MTNEETKPRYHVPPGKYTLVIRSAQVREIPLDRRQMSAANILAKSGKKVSPDDLDKYEVSFNCGVLGQVVPDGFAWAGQEANIFLNIPAGKSGYLQPGQMGGNKFYKFFLSTGNDFADYPEVKFLNDLQLEFLTGYMFGAEVTSHTSKKGNTTSVVVNRQRFQKPETREVKDSNEELFRYALGVDSKADETPEQEDNIPF